MKHLLRLFGSIQLSYVLLALIAASILADHHVYVSAFRWWYDAERFWLRENQEIALSHAIEQYWYDFPTATVNNSAALADELGGKNPKNVRYLKVEKYRRDSPGRLLDIDGDAFVIEIDGSKFRLCAPQCMPEMPLSGDREHPRNPRS
jgi:hypothetical protein